MQCYAQARPCRRAVAGWMFVTFVYCVETAKDAATFAVECKWETVPKLLNCTVFNDLERH